MEVPGASFSSVEDHPMAEEDGIVMTGVRTVGTPGLRRPEQTWEESDQTNPRGGDGDDSARSRSRTRPLRAQPLTQAATGTCHRGECAGGAGPDRHARLRPAVGRSVGAGQSNPAMVGGARSFLTDLTNFDAKSVDADFSSINAMATGAFSSQATKFFNSSIRSELESALAESRGQIRNLYVQTDNGTSASVYAVVDQVYVNNKISTPQSDVLRILVNLAKVGASWKISDVDGAGGRHSGQYRNAVRVQRDRRYPGNRPGRRPGRCRRGTVVRNADRHPDLRRLR